MVMEKLKKVKELVIETVESYNTDWELELDLTEFIEIVNKTDNLDNAKNSLILGQQNAGNIEVLRGRIDELDGVKKRVDTMQQSIELMQTQLDGLVQQQVEYAQELAGSTPPSISGTEPESANNISIE